MDAETAIDLPARPDRDARDGGSGEPVRIALSLTGGAALGAYQAGAVAALLVAVQRLHHRDADAGRPATVRIDAVGATSAGALVGLLAGRCLLAGLDPVAVLHGCWVRGASWRRLRPTDRHAPLSLGRVESAVRDLLDPRDSAGRPVHRLDPATRSPGPLVLHVVTGSLQGVPYRVPGRGAGPLAATTHVRGTEFVLHPGEGVEAFTEPARSSPVDVVLASISHPAVFPPRLLERRREHAGHRGRDAHSVPASGHEWSADGAALLADPLGRSLAAARHAEQLDGAGARLRRMHLLVHPHTAGPDRDGQWTDPARPPGWTDSLSRLVSFLDTQPVYDDLDRIERTNHRVRRAAELVAAIAPQLPPEALPALRGFLDDGADPDAGAADLLGAALAEVAGLAGRREVGSEVISPLRLLDDDGQAQRKVPDLLAGDGVGRFGGFLRPELRHRDFVTGWRSTRAWLPTALRRHGLPDADVGAALTAVDEHVLPPGYRSTRWSAARARLRLARTGTRAVRIAAAGAVRSR